MVGRDTHFRLVLGLDVEHVTYEYLSLTSTWVLREALGYKAERAKKFSWVGRAQGSQKSEFLAAACV